MLPSTPATLQSTAVLATLVLALAASAGGGLAFSDPIFLSGDGASAASDGMQMQADVARGSERFLAVWSDYRSSPDDSPPFASEGSGADIFAARLDAIGNPIDTDPILINQAFGDQVRPVVAWDGHHWHNWRDQLRDGLRWVLRGEANGEG